MFRAVCLLCGRRNAISSDANELNDRATLFAAVKYDNAHVTVVRSKSADRMWSGCEMRTLRWYPVNMSTFNGVIGPREMIEKK